jgi:anthranilate synthase component 1
LLGGLVGASSYDMVRYFERLPSRHKNLDGTPDAHYLAPQSMLVFDHLTRSMALLHSGSEAERQSLRKEVMRALRGAVPGNGKAARYSEPVASLGEAEYIHGVKRVQEHIAAGDVYQLVLSSRFSGRCDLDPFETYRHCVC